MTKNIGSIANLMKDLIAAKNDFPSFKKTGEAKIKTEKGNYEYEYLELPEILEIVTPILSKHNLTVYQEAVTSQDCVTTTTWIFHSSGEWMQSAPFSLPYIKGNQVQKVIHTIGTLVTYCRRYQLLPILGIAGRDDDGIVDGEEAGPLNSSMKPPQVKPKENEPITTGFAGDKYYSGTSEADPFVEQKPKKESNQPQAIDQDLFGSQENSKPPKAKKTTSERQAEINIIAGILENDYFIQTDKDMIAGWIKVSETIPKLKGITEWCTQVVKISNLMENKVFTDQDKTMMRGNVTKAGPHIDTLIDLERQIVDVIEIRESKEQEKEIY